MTKDPEFYSYVVTKEEYEEEGLDLCYERFDVWNLTKKVSIWKISPFNLLFLWELFDYWSDNQRSLLIDYHTSFAL